MTFHLIFEVFRPKFSKNTVVKAGKYDEKTEYFEKKTLSSFRKASVTKLKGTECHGDGRMSFLING